MAHAQKPDFVFRRNGRVHLNQRGRQFSRLLVAKVCASAIVMLHTPCSEIECKTTGYPLHSPVSPSLPLPCVTVCHHISTGVYQVVVCQVSLGECQGNTGCLFYRFTKHVRRRLMSRCGIAVGKTRHGQRGLKVHLACSDRLQAFPVN